jgi:hypothetical protein
MAAPAGSLSPTERLAVCASLAPDIAQVTADFYAPEEPHPYLRSPSGGGVLLREVATRSFENFTQVSVSGIPVEGYLPPELLQRSGLPVEVPEDAVLWSIVTDHLMYPAHRDNTFQPQSSGMTAHSWNYWDGKQWHTARNAEPKQGVGERLGWVTSIMMPEELLAIRAVAKQTRGLHQLAEVYKGDVDLLEDDMSELDVDDETKKLLSVAFASALSMARTVEAVGLEPRGFMTFQYSGFQNISRLMDYIPTGKSYDQVSGVSVSSVEAVLAKMYRGSAFIQKDSMRKRAYRARIRGNPLPLPAAW